MRTEAVRASAFGVDQTDKPAATSKETSRSSGTDCNCDDFGEKSRKYLLLACFVHISPAGSSIELVGFHHGLVRTNASNACLPSAVFIEAIGKSAEFGIGVRSVGCVES